MREDVMWGLAAALAVTIVSCAAGDKVPTGSSSSSGAGGSAGAGGGAPQGDAIPKGAVSFYNAPSCPEGWARFDSGKGRVLVPSLAGMPSGTPVGAPLTSGEDRTHTHDVMGTFTLPDVSYVGIAGGGNGGVSEAGDVSFMTTSDPASTGIPYLQLLACKKTVDATPRSTPLPAGMRMFFEGDQCPDGFQQVASTQGRMLVGLPDGAPAEASFGGPPIDPMMTLTHDHDVDADLMTTPHGIALASGCCGGGYAKNGSYTFATKSTAAEPAMPYLALLQCEAK